LVEKKVSWMVLKKVALMVVRLEVDLVDGMAD